MKFSARSILVHSLFGATALASPITPPSIDTKRRDLPLVDVARLESGVEFESLLKHANRLQDFAEEEPVFNRAAGTLGHNLTLAYIVNTLRATDYYNILVQTFGFVWYEGDATFQANEVAYTASDFAYSPNTGGESPIAAGLARVDNYGCDLNDFSSDVVGKLALISRGSCEFGLKVALAGASGALGAIIYNNAPGPIGPATLAALSRPEGPYVPVASISGEDAVKLLETLARSPLEGSLVVNSLMEDRYTANIIATTVGGDQNNVVLSGAHTDSVPKGPGINDNGSGTIANLEIALMLTQYSVTNAVRFCFWSAQEVGLLGSSLYVANTNDEDLQKIALYLNLDTIASPNPGYFVYGGNSSSTNRTTPAGSDKIEHLLQAYYKSANITSASTPFDGQSDYVGFGNVGVPIGGIFSGTDGIKTDSEAALWGGAAQEPYDPNYKTANDVVGNLNPRAFVQNTKAAAHAIGTYAASTEGFPKKMKAARYSRRGVQSSDRLLVRRTSGKKTAAIR